jgi:hypothetical protein
VDALLIARLQALGRVAIGAGLVLAPERLASGWLGADARRPGTRVALAGLGARDLAIGAGAAWALGGGEDARGWLLAGVVVDATDLAVTIARRDALPTFGVVAVGAIAAASTAIGLRLLGELE